jgi:hypothetical protein
MAQGLGIASGYWRKKLGGSRDRKMELRKIARTIHGTRIILQRLVFAAGWEMVIGSKRCT